MHLEVNRTPQEIITDKILLLSLFSLSSEKCDLESLLKAQKLSFLAAAPLFWEHKKAFSLEFYRHNKGAMANGVYTAIDDFNTLGFIRRRQYLLSNPSDRARKLVEEFFNEVVKGIPENKFVYDQLMAVVTKYGNLRASRLTDLVYKMRVPILETGEQSTVKETPLYRHFTFVLDAHESISQFIIPDDWMDTLSIALSPSNHANLIAAQKSPTIFAHS